MFDEVMKVGGLICTACLPGIGLSPVRLAYLIST